MTQEIKDLIADAREWAGSYASWGDNGLVDRLVDALEATLGEPNGDDELIEYALDYIENGTMRPERREALRALAARATVPDAATEALEAQLENAKAGWDSALRIVNEGNEIIKQVGAERDAALAEIESRIEDRDYWYGIANMAKSQRDAATSAVDRVRALVVEQEAEMTEIDIGQILAALDGAPEPEWEYDVVQNPKDCVTNSSLTYSTLEKAMSHREQVRHMGHGDRLIMRRRKAGPWEPVEGESDANR